MNTAPAAARPSRRTAVWWLHCLLVMLLVFDQLSAPLHRHHHDNGVDATGVALGQPHADHTDGLDLDDLDDDDEPPAGYHATGAPRSEATASGQAVDASPDAASAIGAWLSALWLANLAPAEQTVWPLALALDLPARPIPLSRPPDGRAPPQLA